MEEPLEAELLDDERIEDELVVELVDELAVELAAELAVELAVELDLALLLELMFGTDGRIGDRDSVGVLRQPQTTNSTTRIGKWK